MKYTTIGVIGAGVMGIGTTVDLVLKGKSVVLVDISSKALDKAKQEIAQMIRFAPLLKPTLPKMTPEQALARIEFSLALEDVAACDYIIENATEEWTIKQPIYQALSGIIRPEICVAADTSCLSITKIASAITNPERVIGIHFMNPVYLKDTVEVIKGHHTSESCLERTLDLLSEMEKQAVVVDDLPGFVSNRISHIFMNEAAAVVQDGIATPAQVDQIFRGCFNHTMGPLETADLIGLDTVMKSLDVLYDSYHDPKYRVCALLRKMVDAGQHGKKTGQGFYKY